MFGFCDFLGIGGGDGAGVVVVGSSKNEISGQSEVVYPVGMRREGADQSALCRVPELDRFIVRGRIDGASTAPADARNRGFVTRKNEFYAF